MSLANFAARRRRSLLTLLFMLIGSGIIAAFFMPVALFPNVQFPRTACSTGRVTTASI